MTLPTETEAHQSAYQDYQSLLFDRSYARQSCKLMDSIWRTGDWRSKDSRLY